MKDDGIPSLVRRLDPMVREHYPKVYPKLIQTLSCPAGAYNSSDSVRLKINSVARSELGQMEVDTIEIRLLLDDYDNLEYWYMNFTTKVLPFWESQL